MPIATPIPRIEVDGQPEMILDEPPVYRVDVFTNHWKQLKKRFNQVATPIPRIRVDSEPYAVVDELPVYRVDVFTLHYEQLKKRVGK